MMAIFSEYQSVFWIFSILSLFFFIGSLAALPWLVGRLPGDYFLNLGKEPNRIKTGNTIAVMILKNSLGGLIFIAGIIMLFTPGQGLLTMVAGIVVMEFPGKKKLICYLSGFPKVRSGLNWLRLKKGRPPLVFPQKY